MRPSLGERVRLRAEVTHAIRSYFASSDAIEIEVPTLVPNPGNEAHLRAFEVRTRSHAFEGRRYLHTSPEFAIKASLARLEADVFTFARSYRDEPPSPWHAPEFTMLEWYRRTDAEGDVVRDVDAIVRAAYRVSGAEAEWPAPREVSLVARYAELGVDARRLDRAELASALLSAGVHVDESWDAASLFTLLYVECIEPALMRGAPATDRAPVIVTGFPAHQAALAKLGDDGLARRFEVYLPAPGGAVELANAFAELTDPAEQRARFAADDASRGAAGEPVYPSPERMLAGIAEMQPTVGIALGLERLLTVTASHALGWETEVSDWWADGA